MPLFQCQGCGCVENTALSHHAWRVHREKLPPICSACDPEIGKWHGLFDREDAATAGYLLGADGFLYSPSSLPRHTSVVGPVPPLTPQDPTMTDPTPQTPAPASVSEALLLLARAIETQRDRQKCGIFMEDLVDRLDPAYLRRLAEGLK